MNLIVLLLLAMNFASVVGFPTSDVGVHRPLFRKWEDLKLLRNFTLHFIIFLKKLIMKESEFLYKGHRNSYTEINEVYFRMQWSVGTPITEAS